MIRFLMLAAPLLILAAPASAQAVGTDTAGAPAAADVKPRKVCRSVQVTGRRIAESKCYTAAQWADLDKTNNEAANKFVSSVTAGGGKSGVGTTFSTGALIGVGP